ncbi:MAG TPA: hypothetical protein PLV92_15110, partial [Pirellulaceae bacterium]|nr:hypothetical protein [Pirellulaceae bacterium]
MIVSSLGNRRNFEFDSRKPSPPRLASVNESRPPAELGRQPTHATWLAAALATLLAILGSSTASAQPGNTGDKQVLNVFRPAPRELVLRINRAKKAIEAEEYSDAVLELGRLLAELEQPEEGGDPMAADNIAADSQDYFIGPKNEQGTHVSLKTEAHRLIGSMPPKGREWYELQFGAEARKLLDDAAQTGDVVQLTTASRRFFHTKAGYEATLLLGRRYMDQGQPLAAALSFKRLADSPVAADFEPELSLLLSACWYQAGLPDKAGQTLAALAKRQGNAQVQVGGGAVDLPKDEQRGVKWLSDLVGSRRSLARESLEWLMFRGNATRTGRVNADIPLVTPRWRTPTVNNPT